MEIILIVIIVVILLTITSFRTNDRIKEKATYAYTAKEHLMTVSEEAFFRLLSEVVSEKYLVLPQVHLSALLEHKIPKQNWKYAFRHINGKSVDYVLCDKITLKPVYVIELDDYTHKYKNRVERDTEVERIFAGANIPLVRFSDYKNLSPEDIIAKLSNAYIAKTS